MSHSDPRSDSSLDFARLITAPSRFALWSRVIDDGDVQSVAEVGVYRAEFAEAILSGAPGISRYYLIDPWRHLDDWNKPANQDDHVFDSSYREALKRIAPWRTKCLILRGRTAEVSDRIPDESLDLVYIDGDHTLRGITIDVIRMWPKVRPGGLLGGDDFCPSIWQHDRRFEPTLIFPFVVHFAEAMGVPITALPYNQFLIQKTKVGFGFADPLGIYQDTTLRATMRRHPADRLGVSSLRKLAHRIVR